MHEFGHVRLMFVNDSLLTLVQHVTRRSCVSLQGYCTVFEHKYVLFWMSLMHLSSG